MLSEDEAGLDSPVAKVSVAAKRNDHIHPVSGMRTDGAAFSPAAPNTSHFNQLKSKSIF